MENIEKLTADYATTLEEIKYVEQNNKDLLKELSALRKSAKSMKNAILDTMMANDTTTIEWEGVTFKIKSHVRRKHKEELLEKMLGDRFAEYQESISSPKEILSVKRQRSKE